MATRPYGSVYRGQYDELAEKAIRIARRHGASADWCPFIYEAAYNGVVVTGAPCPPVTRGERAGEPNLRRHDRSRLTKVVVAYPKKKFIGGK